MLIKETENKRKKTLMIVLIVLSVLAALKTIFISVIIDEEYQVSMACRLLKGERMILDLWDPHQTSVFLTEFFVWIYRLIFHTFDGVMIWVRFWGCMIHLAVSYLLYRLLTDHLSKEYSFYLGLLYFNLLPKSTVVTDYANMFIWLVTLSCICICYLRKSEKMIYAVLCGICMSLMVLSYPSSVLFFPFLLVLIFKTGKRGPAFGLCFTLVCVVSGTLYLLMLIGIAGSFSSLLENVGLMLEGHSNYTAISYTDKFLTYVKEMGISILICGCYCLISGIIAFLIYKITKKKISFSAYVYINLAIAAVHHVIHWILMLHLLEVGYNYAVYILLFAFSFIYIRKTEDKIKGSFFVWTGASILALVCVLILTDQTIYSSFKYMYFGYVFALAVLMLYSAKSDSKVHEKYSYPLLLVICLSAIFVKGWHYPANGGVMSNVLSVRGIVKEGITKGILTEYMTSYISSSGCREILEYVPEGSSLLVVDNSPVAYFYEDVNISSYTTICGAPYNETLLEYWDRHPDKYPDVIAISCWYGDLYWDNDSWIVHWIEDKYPATVVIDGNFFRYYIR